MDIFALCDTIRETSFSLHAYLKHGHLEKVYENGLSHRLGILGLKVIQQYPLSVLDEDGTRLGDYYADLFVEEMLIVELKATRCLAPEHIAQLLGYLRGCRVEHGLLINFGSPRLEIRKFVLSREPALEEKPI
jgi:GxxExxY protein